MSVWHLDNHVVIHGDCTDVRFKKWIKKHDVIVYDPPYEINGIWRHIPKPRGLQKLLIFWNGYYFSEAVYNAVSKGWKGEQEFIWDCVQNITKGDHNVMQRHKACGLFSNKKTKEKMNFKKRLMINEYDDYKLLNLSYSYSGAGGNTYLKSIEQIPNSIIKKNGYKHSKPLNWIVAILSGLNARTCLDMFGGSGTVLLACEKLKIKSLTIEKDLEMCKLIVDRWENATNKEGDLVYNEEL